VTYGSDLKTNRISSRHTLALGFALSGAGLAALSITQSAIADTAAPLEAQPAAQSADGTVGLEEIVVTATHRKENLQKVPIAITALSAAQLETNPNQLDLHQIQQQIPSLQVEGYSGRNQTITIRGLGTNAGGTNDGLEQGVGLYIDDVYYARTGTALEDLINIESIAVLRGPQGTLFGKNTVAGAVDIHTNPASFTPSESGEFSYGNYNFYNARIDVTGPITDDLAGQISLSRTGRSGLVYSTVFDHSWDNRKDTNIQADLVWEPTEDFKYRLKVDWDYEIGDMGFQVLKSYLPTTAFFTQSFAQKAAPTGFIPTPANPFGRTTDINSPEYARMPSGGITGRGDWDLGDFTLTSISAYRFYKWYPQYDGDQTGADILGAGGVATRQQQAQQEFRITSPKDETIEYTAGLFGWWQRDDDFQKSVYGEGASQFLYSATANPAWLNGVTNGSVQIPTTQSYALYGQATWHITPDLSLTGGARYTYEYKTGVYSGSIIGNYVPLSALPASQRAQAQAERTAVAPTSAYNVQVADGKPSWMVNLSYNFTDDIMGYVTSSRGYKSAGINLVQQTTATGAIPIIVEPEKVDDQELGVKTALFNNRLTLNADLFWTIDDNFQANFYNIPLRTSYIANVGKVRTRGLEVDAKAEPIDGLTFTLSSTYDDAAYLNYTNGLCPYLQTTATKKTCDLSGDALTGVPRWSISTSVEYAQPLTIGARDVVGYVGGDWHLQSHFFSAVNDDIFSLAPGYQLVDLHAGIKDPDGKWDIEGWVRNLLNQNYYNTITVNNTYLAVNAVLGDPRMFGITLRTKF
jgi:iron complex outermembrane receptor protein